MRIDVYTWQDAYVSTIGPEELLSFTHTDELNGEDSVDITTTFALKQGYRLVWADRLGKVHEHVCQDPKGIHAGGDTVYTDTAINSICETYGDYIEDKRPYGYGFLQALNVCLGPTRWTAGTVDQTGTVDKGLTFYHTSAREALQSILECGGELETEITVSGGKVTSRMVGIRSHRGANGGHRRFTYTKDLASVSRTEHYGAITACYGYGKGIETDTGGYGRKLTFGDINNGKNYVEDATALKLYGRPDGMGGRAHVFGQYENSNCEDAATLLAETRAYLDSRKEPGMTYEVDAVDLMQFGRDWEGVAVGDDVQIVDTAFRPALRCEGRVTKLVTDQLGGTVRVTLGNVTETIADMWLAQQKQVSSLSKRSSSWDVAASTPPSYLQQVVDAMNTQFNMSGSSYTFTSFEQGTIYASVPMDANGRSTTGKGSAMQLCSQGFRIASGCKADGSWDWRTFGTGAGFTADLITVGTLTGDLIKAGTIADRLGRNSWNLTTGTLKTNYMTANNITANGTFKCGYTNWYTMLTSEGELAGYRTTNGSTPTKVGYIDYTASMRDTDTGAVYYGIQMQAQGSVRISSPIISTAATSDRNVTTTYGRTGSVSQPLVSEVHDNHDGTVGWHYGTFVINTINGLVTSYSTVGTG